MFSASFSEEAPFCSIYKAKKEMFEEIKATITFGG